ERFLDRRLVIPAMDLVEVDIIHAEPVQAGVDLAHDCFARQAAAVRTGAHPAIYLGRNDHLVAAGEILDSPSEDLLAAAERITVRGVEEIDAAFECLLDERAGFLLGEAPGMVAAIGGAVAHAAEADTRDVEAGAAELHIFHRLSHGRPKRNSGRLWEETNRMSRDMLIDASLMP